MESAIIKSVKHADGDIEAAVKALLTTVDN